MIHHWAAALFASAHISNVVLREEAGLSAPLHLFLGTSEQGRSQEGPGPRLPACLLGPLIVFHGTFKFARHGTVQGGVGVAKKALEMSGACRCAEWHRAHNRSQCDHAEGN